MNFLRNFLGDGFQNHMQANSFLHHVFDFTPFKEKPETLPAKVKRMLNKPNCPFKDKQEALLSAKVKRMLNSPKKPRARRPNK